MQLFDFGLAKELKNVDRVKEGQYLLTGMTGTLRVMSPEVIQRIPYGLSTDIFSFGIFIWEVFSGDRSKLVPQQVCKGQRPDQSGIGLPAALKSDLLKGCWHEKPSKRPTMGQVCEKIRKIRKMEKERR